MLRQLCEALQIAWRNIGYRRAERVIDPDPHGYLEQLERWRW